MKWTTSMLFSRTFFWWKLSLGKPRWRNSSFKANKSVPVIWLSAHLEPSVRAECLTDSSPLASVSLPESSFPRPLVPVSPHLHWHTALLCSLLPMQMKYQQPTTLTGLFGCQRPCGDLQSASCDKEIQSTQNLHGGKAGKFGAGRQISRGPELQLSNVWAHRNSLSRRETWDNKSWLRNIYIGQKSCTKVYILSHKCTFISEKMSVYVLINVDKEAISLCVLKALSHKDSRQSMTVLHLHCFAAI